MRRLLAIVLVFGALGYALIGCSSSPSKPAVSHADQLACRTVYRLQELANVSPLAFSNQTATNSLSEAAVGTTPKSFYESFVVTGQEIAVIGYSNTLIKPLVNECAAMGITTKNFEDVS